MANMSGKDTYTNDTDGRDNSTEPFGRGGTASSKRGNIASPERCNAASSKHDGDGALLEHGDASPSERDNVTSPQHSSTVLSKRDDTASPENNAAPANANNCQPESSVAEPVKPKADAKQAAGIDPSPADDATEPNAIHGPKHAASTDEEAASRSNRAEVALFDERSASHAAKPASIEHRISRAAETASAYLQKAGDFLGLHKKATAISAAIALCVVVGISAAVASSSRPTPNGIPLSSGFASYAANVVATTTDAAADEAAAGLIAQRLTPDALNSVGSFATTPDTFSLIEGEDATPLSEEQQESLAAATQNIEGGGYTVGFTLINLNTGKGIAYNLDSRVYGASSFKGPYAAYLCQHLGDNDASYPSGSEAAGSGVSSSIYSLMQPMILYSDNSAFSSLRNTYDSAGFAEWLNSCGVDSEIMHDTHFPRYSARESALLWLHTYQYLKTNTPTAQNLASLYERTNVSFIRSGVSDDEEVEAVLNKAGWCSGRERFTGLCDVGLIKCTDGTTYLMSTMTNSPDGGLYTVRLANLASTLFECRDVLE